MPLMPLSRQPASESWDFTGIEPLASATPEASSDAWDFTGIEPLQQPVARATEPPTGPTEQWRAATLGVRQPKTEPSLLERAGEFVVTSPVVGAKKIAHGAQTVYEQPFFKPGSIVPTEEALGGIHEMVGGAFTALTPLFIAAGIAEPWAAFTGLVISSGAAAATDTMAHMLGASSAQAAVLGDIAAIIAPGTLKNVRQAIRRRLGIEMNAAAPTEPRVKAPVGEEWDFTGIAANPAVKKPPPPSAAPETVPMQAPVVTSAIEPPPVRPEPQMLRDTEGRIVATEPAVPEMTPLAPAGGWDFRGIEPEPTPAYAGPERRVETREVPYERRRQQFFQEQAEGRVAVNQAREAQGLPPLREETPRLQPEEGTSKAPAYEHASTQLALPEKVTTTLTEIGNGIKDGDLTDRGRELEPHVTVAFGLENKDVGDVRKLLKEQLPITIEFGKLSLFTPDETGKDYEVLKAEIESPELRALNEKIREQFEPADTKPYKPHATIAYVKPGTGEAYLGASGLEGQTVTLHELTFTKTDGKQVTIPLGGKVEAPVPVGAAIGAFQEAPASRAPVPPQTATLPFETKTTPTGQTVQSITSVEFPELVGMVHEITGGKSPEIVKFRNEAIRGMFRSRRGAIQIHPDLFKAGNEQQLASTLAHEMGHWTDWLPDKMLQRGNLVGRLYSLKHHLTEIFSAPGGTTVSNKTVRAELTALSDHWRPWDKASAPASFKQYRARGEELYADFFSALMRDPELAKRMAPTAYEHFFNGLDRKPETKQAYFALQELLSGTHEDVVKQRLAGDREMFEKANTKAIDLERQRQEERKASLADYAMRMRIEYVDKNTPIVDFMKGLDKQGIHVSPDEDPRYFLSERNYLGAKQKGLLESEFHPIYEKVTKAGVDWHTFDQALLYERIIAGDRSELANPRGIQPADATERYRAMMQTLSAPQRRVISDGLRDFRGSVRAIMQQAYEVGLVSDEMYANIQKNPAYATFQTVEHLGERATHKIFRQKGTLGEISSAADATVQKALATFRAIEQQKMKRAVFDAFEKYGGEIEQAKEVWTGRTRVPIEAKDRKLQRLVTYYEAGHLRGKYVDPYVADSLENVSIGQNWTLVKGLQLVNSNVFRPLFTTVNLGFQTYNLRRDFGRFWKNIPKMSIGNALQLYWQAIPLAKARAFGLKERPSASDLAAYKDLMSSEKAGILGISYDDLMDGREQTDTQIERTFHGYGVGTPPHDTAGRRITAPIRAIVTWMKEVGDFFETLPKAAGIYHFRGEGRIADINPAQRAYIREKIGSPDFLAGGTYKPITNNVLLFSNAFVQGIRTDFRVATDPVTRAGWWWKTAAIDIVPKLLMFAAVASAVSGKKDDGDESRWDQIKRAFMGASEYDMTNYTVIPLGIDEDGKSTYIRLPNDDSGRLVGGLTWKLIGMLAGKTDFIKSLQDLANYTAGQAPSLTPIATLGKDVGSMLAGQNVYDPFRNRFLFTNDEVKARNWNTLRKFVGYEFQQMGGSAFWKFYAGEQRPRETTKGEKILDLPVVSNIVGRWIKISHYGQTERIRAEQGMIAQGEARGRLDERGAINDAIAAFQKMAPEARTKAEQRSAAREIVSNLAGDETAQVRDEHEARVEKKLKMGLIRGEDDPLTDAVLSAQSNNQKVGLILRGAESMSEKEFSAWLFEARKEGVVSANVWRDVHQQRRNKTQ